MNDTNSLEARRMRRTTAWLAVVLLLPCLYGFSTKFYEFVVLYQGDSEGAFAVTPIVNYLLASTGFLLMFGWAAANGMFHDIERPKHRLLETERELDAQGS